MDDLSFAHALKSSIDGVFLFITQDCLRFYTSKTLEKYKANTWVPWDFPRHTVYDSLIINISDDKLRELFDLFRIDVEKMDGLNIRWLEAFIKFFNVFPPKTIQEKDELVHKIINHRKRKGPTWMDEPVCQQLLAEMQPIVAELERLKPLLDQEMSRVYGHILITDEDFGDQRAKDLIDASDGVFAKEAIKLLQKALTYGETGIQASKAFMVLGMRYEQLGEIDLAIENYSKSLEAYRQPYGMTYFWRGKLYYQQQKWEAARDDFAKAVSLEDQLLSPEKEEAKQLLQELNRRLG